MQVRTTYFLAFVALGLFCYIFFFDVKNKSTNEARRTARQVFSYKIEEPNWLKITNLKGSVTLEKKGEQWKITQPVEAIADTVIVNQVVDGLRFAFNQRVIPYSKIPEPKEETIKQWNLNPPAVEIDFKTADHSGKLLLGRSVAQSDFVYGRASDQAGDPVQLISNVVKKAADRSLNDFRSKTLFVFNPELVSECDAAAFATGIQTAEEMEINKDKARGWTIQKPIQARASELKVRDWLQKLNKLRAVDFVSDESSNLSAYGLSTPAAQIKVKSGDHDETTLLVGSATPQGKDFVYAKLSQSNSIFTLKKAEIDEIFHSLATVRDPFLIAFNPELIQKISIEQKGKILSLQREPSFWKIDGPSETIADTEKVNSLLNHLTVTEVSFVKDSAIDLRLYGLDKPPVKIILQQPLGMSPESIELDFGRQEKNMVYAINSLEPYIYGVSPEVLEEFPQNALNLKNLQILKLKREKIDSIKITFNDGSVSAFTLGTDHLFHAAQPGAQVDDLKLETKLKLLSDLKAANWLNKSAVSNTLPQPILTLTVNSEGKSHTIEVRDHLPNGNYAAIIDPANNPDLFELSMPDFDLLNQNPVLSSAASPSKKAN